MRQKLLDFWSTRPEEIMFLQVAGSQSYNLALPDSSDYDFLGVFVSNTEDILRLNPPRDHYDGNDPDFQLHEVGKFCHLLAKGNPTIIEVVFASPETHIVAPPWRLEWSYLQMHRRQFLNQRTLKQYLGYAQGQYRRLVNHQPLHATGGQFNTKWAYHIIRLLKNALEIAKGKEPTIWWEGQQRDFLMSIREGHYPQETVEGMMRSIIADIEGLKPWKIPPEPDLEWIDSWLLEVRRIAY